MSCASFRRRELVLSRQLCFPHCSATPTSSAAFMGHSGISGKNKTGHHRTSLPFLPLFPCAYSSVQRRIPPPALSPLFFLDPPLPFLIHAWRGISGGGRTIPLCSRGGEGAGGEGGAKPTPVPGSVMPSDDALLAPQEDPEYSFFYLLLRLQIYTSN